MPEKWGFPYLSKQLSERIAAGIAKADAVLLGPRTYSLFMQLWRHQGDEVPMAKFLNNSPKYVVSSSIQSLEWPPATLMSGELATAVRKLKAMPGKDIQVPGSPKLVRSLLREGLLDELNLIVCPVVVGTGLRLFDGLNDPIKLNLAQTIAFDNGAIAVSYRPLPQKVEPTDRPQHFPQAASRDR
jgi:dihydrofolate reductase